MNKNNDIYTKVAEEIENGVVDKGLWARATELSKNDANGIKSRYIGLRVKELKFEIRQIKRKRFFSKLKIIIPTALVIVGVIILFIYIAEERNRPDQEAVRQKIADIAARNMERGRTTAELFLGQNASVGNISFSEMTTEQHGSRAPERFFNPLHRLSKEKYESAGKFISISFLITNTASTTRELSKMTFSLQDTKDLSFTSVSTVGKCEELKPNIPCKIEVLFETAPDSVLQKITFDYWTNDEKVDDVKFGI